MFHTLKHVKLVFARSCMPDVAKGRLRAYNWSLTLARRSSFVTYVVTI